MHKFSGTYYSKLDKGRCFFPAAFRKELPDAVVAHLKVRVTENDAKYLEVFEENDWKERIEMYEKAIGYIPLDEESEEDLADFTGSVETIEMELKSDTNPGNVGRILIPKKKLEQVGITNEVVFVGSTGMIMVWDKEKYENRPVRNMKDKKAKYIEQERLKRQQ